MSYLQPDMYARTGDWLVNTVRRKPEALLLLAAGCALMMRAGRGSSSSAVRGERGYPGNTYGDPSRMPGGRSSVSGVTGSLNQAAESAAEGLHQAADSAAEYVGDIKNRVSDTASSYASTVAGYADDARRNLSAGSERLRTQAHSAYQAASESLREQPLVIAAVGLAAGAAVAAFLPGTDVERRTLAPVGNALAEAAGKAGDNLREAADNAGEKLKEGAAERGLDPAGLKDFARDVAGTFTSAAVGDNDKSGRTPGATTPPNRAPL